jgi:hypothetical protein
MGALFICSLRAWPHKRIAQVQVAPRFHRVFLLARCAIRRAWRTPPRSLFMRL